MNVHATTALTPVETALVDSFAEQASLLPGNAAVIERRDDAVERIKAGLPTRRVEAWHYTDLRRLLNAVPDRNVTTRALALEPLLQGALIFSVDDGKAIRSADAAGLSHASVESRLMDGSLGAELAIADADDAIGAINAAFVSDGHSLDIAAGTELSAPVELQNLHAGGQVHARFPVTVGAGAKATIVERQTGEGAALVTSVSSLTLGEGAEIVWVIVQEQPTDTTHLAQFAASLAADAKLTLFIMNTGGKLVRQEVRISVDGEGAEFKLRGVNMLGGDTHCDVTMVLDHVSPHTVSTEIIRNVVTDRAHGVFQGQIRVAPVAQKTDAKMSCNTLLLSDDAEFSAKPELEIFADDVACGHGATVTEIDGDHLFYLMARGVPEKLARGLLVKAFVAEIVEELEDEALVVALEAKLDAWFAQHG